MKIKMLSKEFYIKYADKKEILQKENRPYLCLTIEIDSIIYAIPFRHNISHKHCFLTLGNAGLDYSKAVIISDKSYLSDENVSIENKEFAIVKKNEKYIKRTFLKYIRFYKKALLRKDIERNYKTIRYSSLQYFEDILLK